MTSSCDYLVIGGGIIGLTLASRLKTRNPAAKIILIEKEDDVACHTSGRNSGVLHAGFYYTADSLKARFTVAGNKAMREYCKSKGIPVNECGKLVVATNEAELEQLYELEKRGKRNGSTIEIISEEQARKIEPNVKTFGKAIHSPLTATVDPKEVCNSLKADLMDQGVEVRLLTAYRGENGGAVITNKGSIEAMKVINCAGLYADKIAHSYGFGLGYTIMPFKGMYLMYSKNQTDVITNIYPVPNLKNPFLGVHFTKTVTGKIKIGPTAIPAFWRENYSMFSNFKLDEFLSILFCQGKLFLLNSFGFRDLAIEEMRKYSKSYFVSLARKLVQQIDADGFTEPSRPGIRAQLLEKRTMKLVQDFVVEGDSRSVHVLNAVSPGFTCSGPFVEYILDNFVAQ